MDKTINSEHPNIDSKQPRLTLVQYVVPQEEYETHFNPNGYTLHIKVGKLLLIFIILLILYLKYKWFKIRAILISMCEAIFIFFGSFILWLGINAVIEGEQKNNHNTSFIDLGILLIILGSILLICAILHLCYSINNYCTRKKYVPLDSEV